MRLTFRGKTLLGYTEKEVWKMTFRKLDLLFKEYCIFNGIKFCENSDEAIPGEDVI